MSEPIKKPDKTSKESYSPKTPKLANMMMEETQRKNAEANEAFIRKNTVELITLDEGIKVVGLSFQKCKQTGLVELNSPMDLYSGEKLDLQANIKNIKSPQAGYGIWSQEDRNLVKGKEVTDLDGQDEIYGSFIIPPGRYAKVSWNAETFSELVMEAMEKSQERSGMNAFLEKNNLIADNKLFIEVYPHATLCIGQENGPGWGAKYKEASMEIPTTNYPEMYTLLTVRGKE